MKPEYLRLSVTPRCNLTCFYCRPPENAIAPPAPADLPVSEIVFLVECAAAEGIRKVRLTGGEPLLRPDLEEIVARIAALPGIREAVLSTNAIGLASRAAALREAGLRRVNVSLDTLRADRFLRITGQDRLGEVMEGIETAARTFDLVKINTVALRGTNDDEIAALVRFAGRLGLHIRFIERYPSIGTEEPSDRFLRGSEVKGLLEDAFGILRPEPRAADAGRAASNLPSLEETFSIPSAGHVRVGLIASYSHPPCSICGKLRFTSQGRFQSCLFSSPGEDARPFLRARDAAGVRRLIRESFSAKPRTGPGCDASVASSVNVVGG